MFSLSRNNVLYKYLPSSQSDCNIYIIACTGYDCQIDMWPPWFIDHLRSFANIVLWNYRDIWGKYHKRNNNRIRLNQSYYGHLSDLFNLISDTIPRDGNVYLMGWSFGGGLLYTYLRTLSSSTVHSNIKGVIILSSRCTVDNEDKQSRNNKMVYKNMHEKLVNSFSTEKIPLYLQKFVKETYIPLPKYILNNQKSILLKYKKDDRKTFQTQIPVIVFHTLDDKIIPYNPCITLNAEIILFDKGGHYFFAWKKLALLTSQLIKKFIVK